MKSLASLLYKDTIESICSKHPKLLYFICYWGNSEKYPILNIIDKQEDCKALSTQYITKYIPPHERVTHGITHQSCSFTLLGKEVLDELYNEKICEDILNFFRLKKNGIDKELLELNNDDYEYFHLSIDEFERKFWEFFTFDFLEQDLVEMKYNEIKNKYAFINLPNKEYKFNRESKNFSFVYDYTFINNIFYFIIKFNCSCSNFFEEYIREQDHNFETFAPYILECDRCKKTYFIVHNFFYGK